MFEPVPHRHRARPQRFALGNISVPGTRAGAVVSIVLVVVAWLAIPMARAFILGTVGLGGAVGAFLWWLHNRE